MTLPLSILLATSNPHKLEEIRAAIPPDAGLSVVSLTDIGLDAPEPVEDQPTFAGNALLKARHYAQAAGMLCLADDSGLEVDALHGAPGVLSARYAGVTGPRSVVDPANNRKLIEQLRDIPPAPAPAPGSNRTARFVCVMALCDPALTWAVVRGSIEGLIIDTPRGSNGFGYDPHFLVPHLDQTTAELTPEEKNTISHRGQATRLMLHAIAQLTR